MLSYWDKKPFPGTIDSLYVKWLAYQMGVDLQWVSSGANDKLLGVGDLLNYAHEGDTLWGIHGSTPSLKLADHNIKANLVQGPLTTRCIDSAYVGHPAWLTMKVRPRILPDTIRIGIFAAPNEWKVLEDIKIRRLDVWLTSTLTTNVGAVLDEILRCEKVATSSVTVYAICHSYGIPATLFSLSEPTFEMMDYCTNEDVKSQVLQLEKEDIERRQFKIAKRIKKSSPLKQSKIDDVLESCPFNKEGRFYNV